ncbi:DNA-binding domain-containing protein [Luteimonas kalidii]|uniref:DNA-binding domain-containing protein n=1 Tax=Luteimonas kalidii TaxID=3042025 RepID=A0ABT6JV95_9GAMM|nr:DNA-binding domain-containing protein [Luteimonas kalidii]MDH5834609.1 DNA-binding domain-containing protein [Luteimonas kalidii]
MNLAQVQDRFLAGILDEAAEWPAQWDARMARGLAVYRENHRHALMEAMQSTFERTRRWVGDAAFAAAAAHHLILRPPTGWTLDAIGDGFPATAAALFPRDPEVGDLAALEWAMHCAFTAADGGCLDLDAWRAATCGFTADDWAGMRLRPGPALVVLDVDSDCVGLWRALADDGASPPPPPTGRAACAIVWREGWQPVCCLATRVEGEALRRIAAGMPYGALCEWLLGQAATPEEAAREAGRMLAWWLQSGLLAEVSSPSAGDHGPP